MSTQLKQLYGEASDFFAYVRGYAPNIPSTGGLTLNSAIDRLFGYVDSLTLQESDQVAKRWLGLCWNEVREAKRHLDNGEVPTARKRLEAAREYLQNADKKKSMQPTIIVGGQGIQE
jgi:hypothetical protein